MLKPGHRGGGQARLYLFDSFSGLPKGNSLRDHWFREGQFAVESVERLLSGYRRFIEIRKGWIPETFPRRRFLC
jgi:hypothetical protein